MEIVVRPLDSIRPYERNPRHNDSAVDAVAASLREFGFRQPIVVDPDGVIVCGHTRFKAAQKLALSELPVHIARDLSPEQLKAYRLADNKTAELADWNLDLLPLELAELKAAEAEEAFKVATSIDVSRRKCLSPIYEQRRLRGASRIALKSAYY